MKLERNFFFIYVVICFGSVDSRSRGKKHPVAGATHIRQYSKSMLKEVDETSLKVKDSTPIPLITKYTLDKITREPIETLSNPLIVTNADGGIKNTNSNTLGFSKPKKISMKVGGHLVKVSSSLHSKHLDTKRKEGGKFKMSVNPKFSHVIEIIPEDELENKDKERFDHFTITKDSLDNEMLSTPLHTDLTSDDKLSDENTSNKPCTGVLCLKDPNNLEQDSERELSTESNIQESLSRPQSISTPLHTDLTSDDKFSDESTSSKPCTGVLCLKDPDDSIQDSEQELSTKSDIKESLSQPQSALFTTPIQSLGFDEIAGSEDSSFEFHENEQPAAFNDEIEGSGEELSSRDVEGDEGDSKSGRLLNFLSRRNISSPNCTTPKGEKGQCRRISQCLLSDALNNFNVFLQQLCLIRGVLVGVCCPDNPVIEISNPDDDNATESSIPVDDIKQPPEGCGLNTKTRIVGGTISLPHEWTWMVALMRRNRFYCGGVIINNWYILTAAHCVMGMDVKDLSVRLGEYDFNEHNKHQEDISVSEIKRHAQFVTLTFQHDIALLKLKRSIQYSKFVGSICLPNQKARDYSDAKGTVVGWGTVSFGGAASPILRQITVPVWKNEDCDETYLLENINEAFMCAGSPEKGEDACQGDSGGPLMTINERGRWEVIGIVSWGRRCGDPKYPGVYTRVTTYLDWIHQNTN